MDGRRCVGGWAGGWAAGRPGGGGGGLQQGPQLVAARKPTSRYQLIGLPGACRMMFLYHGPPTDPRLHVCLGGHTVRAWPPASSPGRPAISPIKHFSSGPGINSSWGGSRIHGTHICRASAACASCALLERRHGARNIARLRLASRCC